jgi:hypothetical protein
VVQRADPEWSQPDPGEPITRSSTGSSASEASNTHLGRHALGSRQLSHPRRGRAEQVG